MRLGALAIKVLALRSKDQQEATKKAKQQHKTTFSIMPVSPFRCMPDGTIGLSHTRQLDLQNAK